MSKQQHPIVVRRILASAEHPEAEASELDWIDGELASVYSSSDDMEAGEVFMAAVRRVQELIDNGTLIVVREEEMP